MSNAFTRSCPYNCGCTQDVEATEGFQLITCPECSKPWIMETTYVPYMQARMVEGFGIQRNEVTPTITFHNPPQPEETTDYMARLKERYEKGELLSSNDRELLFPMKEGHWFPSKEDVLICAQCGKGYEDHGITDGVCPTCFLDEDSVKGITVENEPRNEFKPLITNTKVLYRCDPEYVDIKYCQNAHVRTSWADIYSIIEEVEEDRRPIIASLLGAEGNKPKVTGVCEPCVSFQEWQKH